MLSKYYKWLHGRWPAGHVEKLPVVNEDGSTKVPGLFVAGDLRGVPLLKFALDSGARTAGLVAAELGDSRGEQDGALDLAIIGGGVAGMAAAVEAKGLGLSFVVIEAAEPFSTIVNFPKGKPIFTYPTEMDPAGDLTVSASVKEELVAELCAQVREAGVETRSARAIAARRKGGLFEIELSDGEPLRARRVIVALGRSGNFRKLGVPGEDRGKVVNRLHDPADYNGARCLVVGGGDSAVETALALEQTGANVVLAYRGDELSRPKPENLERLRRVLEDPQADVDLLDPVSERVTTAEGAFQGRAHHPGRLRLLLGTSPKSIDEQTVVLSGSEGEETLPNDAVFSMIGREPPLDFFRRSGVDIHGESSPLGWAALAAFLLACAALYDWKGGGFLEHLLWEGPSWPANTPGLLASLGDWWAAKVSDRGSVLGTLAVSMKGRSFYYTLVYTLCIGVYGFMRVRRRKTPYVTVQTVTLFLVQAFPLFLLPELLFPWLGYNGAFDAGLGKTLADHLFPSYISDAAAAAQQWPDWGHPRAYWKAYGLVLAWPLNVYNVFTAQPQVAWLSIAFVQTFVIIPGLVWRWGKGAYCGWICSCGALAETLGDTQRTKMPHGPRWNRLNMIGQVFLAAAFVLLALRLAGWAMPGSWPDRVFPLLFEGKNAAGELVNPVSWKWFVDVLFGGILGVGLYFKLSGRVWCRFACPLAALMHLYARFSRFAILPEKKKCISCNVCTSVCHQGIDVMNFANKGLAMQDPECVRCSACVQSCPTGVLQFGRVDTEGVAVSFDSLAASAVRAREAADGN